MKTRSLSLLMAAVMAASVAGCSSSNSTSTSTADSTSGSTASATNTSSDKKILSVQIGPNPETLDPALNSAVDGGNMILTNFECLLTNDENGQIAPGAAESWEVSEDGKTYTFKLRLFLCLLSSCLMFSSPNIESVLLLFTP